MISTEQHAHKLAIAAALRNLEHSLELFVAALAHQAGPVSAEGAGSDADARRRICEAFAAIDYAQEDEANQAHSCLGVVGGSAAVIDRAEAVNEAKARLREVCAPLQNARRRIPVKDGHGGQVVKSLPLVRVILRELTRSDLNLLAAYRKIPILTGRIERVAYTRALTRAVYRKPRAAILALLEASNRATTHEDLRRLQQLPARETHLALVKQHYTNVRANVWFHGLDSRNRGRVMVSAELPLLHPHGRSREPPEIRYPSAEEGTALIRRPRAGKLEDASFLVTLPVFRYRPTTTRANRR